jgi:hypothetical protein
MLSMLDNEFSMLMAEFSTGKPWEKIIFMQLEVLEEEASESFFGRI